MYAIIYHLDGSFPLSFKTLVSSSNAFEHPEQKINEVIVHTVFFKYLIKYKKYIYIKIFILLTLFLLIYRINQYIGLLNVT